MDSKIRKAEREVGALETTLHQMYGANGSYGASFKKVSSSGVVLLLPATRRYGCGLHANGMYQRHNWTIINHKALPAMPRAEQM